MLPRHWKQIQDKVGFKVDPNIDGFNFTKVLDLKLMNWVDDIVEIGERA